MKMTPKLAQINKAIKAAYLRIHEDREPICEGCEVAQYEHSHRFPKNFDNYRLAAVDENIDLYCRKCHLNWESSRIFLLKNGEEALNYVLSESEEYFMRKLMKMRDRLKEYKKKHFFALSHGQLKIPAWAEKMIKEHLE